MLDKHVLQKYFFLICSVFSSWNCFQYPFFIQSQTFLPYDTFREIWSGKGFTYPPPFQKWGTMYLPNLFWENFRKDWISSIEAAYYHKIKRFNEMLRQTGLTCTSFPFFSFIYLLLSDSKHPPPPIFHSSNCCSHFEDIPKRFPPPHTHTLSDSLFLKCGEKRSIVLITMSCFRNSCR